MSFPGVIELSLGGRGPRHAYVFDPHRLAVGPWARHAGPSGSLLLSFDRHLDTVVPLHPPEPGLSPDALQVHAERHLDERNFDHILAAMNAGVVTHAILVARARPGGAHLGPWVDSSGRTHELLVAPTLASLCVDFGRPSSPDLARQAYALLASAQRIILDVDIDCFTTLSDAQPLTVIPWPLEVIRQHLFPDDHQPFWDLVLSKCVVFTCAREPNHCGGLIHGARLFENAAQVLFHELLKTDLP